jgi:hypothetical protein
MWPLCALSRCYDEWDNPGPADQGRHLVVEWTVGL